MRPDEYWRLTAVELGELLAGAAHRDEQTWERTAWLASHIINIAGKMVKQPISANRLLGRQPEPTFPQPTDPKQKFEELMRRQRELEERRAEAAALDEE